MVPPPKDLLVEEAPKDSLTEETPKDPPAVEEPSRILPINEPTKDAESPPETTTQGAKAKDNDTLKKRGRPRKEPSEESKRVKKPRGRPRKSAEPQHNNEDTETSYSPPPNPPPLYANPIQGYAPASQTGGAYYSSANLAAAAAAATAAAEAAMPNGSTDPSILTDLPVVDAFLTHARKHTDFLLRNSPIYRHLLSDVRVINASPASVTTRLKLESHHLNSKGSLHGSVTATFVDFIGGLAIACFDRRTNTGVSTDLHVSYLGKATAGQWVDIEGIAEKVGGTLAFTRIVVRTIGQNGTEGDLVAMGRHTKFVKAKASVS